MLFDTSYKDKKIEKQIKEAVGDSFSFLDRWKMKGIGSKRLTISDITEAYEKYLNAAHYQSKANIEIRPKGIIVHFRHKLQAYSWVMPFKHLILENKNSLVLISDGKHISFEESLDQTFVEKLNRVRETLKE